MRELEERILRDGQALSKNVLKVDSFLNHQVDYTLIDKMGEDFAERFKDAGITRVFTIESSGIAPAYATARSLNVPMVILKKQTSKILNEDVYQTKITSFTKGTSYELTLYKKYAQPGDKVLLIDDFLANGEAATGSCKLLEMAGVEVVGIGIVIEKAFQRGRKRLENAGYKVYSLARVSKLDEGCIEFIPEED